ncbi:hypothetical protein DB346_19810 [Verrucomicrobia bacterium LW23]|nr:hypothetical protein DB346_19810 [Verrucomicrobia bacterium LW23]
MQDQVKGVPNREESDPMHTTVSTPPGADHVDNREVWKDFGFRATHLMTTSARQIITAWYGQAPEFSYFVGGSTGGQQALQEAQRYPEDYDGIIAAVPAHCRAPLHAYFLWNDQILTKTPFSKEQQAAVVAAGNEYMASREVPAVAGKFVSDPRCTAADIEAVIALALKKDPTLTPAHAEALRKILDGPRHARTGERIFNGIPLGCNFDSARGHLYLFRWVFGTAKPLGDINFAEDIDKYLSELGPWLNADNADLSAFRKRGGKLIITTGTADQIVPSHASVDYYERVIEASGGLEQAQSFCRMYVVPGMAHGPNGPGLNLSGNMLEAVRTWREKGKAPEAIAGKRMAPGGSPGKPGKVELEIPVYPYPAKAAWDEATSTYKPVAAQRGGVERVAERFRPAAAP